ncbi:MAG: hypothetical protein R3Y29_05825, partial [bacterium]
DITEATTQEVKEEVEEEDITESTTQELKEEVQEEDIAEAPIVQSNGRAIYVTKTGKKYHYNNNCNGATYIEITPEELNTKYATLEPCSKCAM